MASIDRRIRKLDEIFATLEALSEGFETGVDPEECIRRLVDAIEEGPARTAVVEELSLFQTALTNSISPLLRRAAAVVSRAPNANDLDRLARIAAFREPLLKGIAATTPRRLIGSRLEDRLRGKLIRAVYAAALISAAIDRIHLSNEGGLATLRRSIEALNLAGSQVGGFGLPIPTASIFDNTASTFLMLLLEFSLAIIAGRRLDERRGDDDGDRPLDDRLEPKPWFSYPQGSTERGVRELLEVRLQGDGAEGDCWLRARSGAARFFAGTGLLTTSKFMNVHSETEAAANPDLRIELATNRVAFLRDMDATRDGTKLRLPQASSTPSTEDRCRDCECDACPMRKRT